jgi:hypothetical protein
MPVPRNPINKTMRAFELLTDDFILETPEEVRGQIVQKIQKIQDQPDLINILKYANQYAFKKDVGRLSTAKGYKEQVSNIILQAVGNIDAPEAQVRAFLKRVATDGVIKEELLLTPGAVHSMEDIVDTKFRPIFNAIKMDLFEKIAGKIGEKGDVGKGEYLLSILSPRIVRRGAPGDLKIVNDNVELKAGSSGRLGPSGSQALAGRFDEFWKNLIKLRVIDPTVKAPNPNVFNPQLNMDSFSAFFGNDQKRVSKALEILLKMHYPSLNVQSIVKSVVSGGTINGSILKVEMLKASFSVYKEAKQFDGILLTDYGINKYLYMNSPESAGSSAAFLTVKFPSWTDTQSNTIKIQLKSRT